MKSPVAPHVFTYWRGDLGRRGDDGRARGRERGGGRVEDGVGGDGQEREMRVEMKRDRGG